MKRYGLTQENPTLVPALRFPNSAIVAVGEAPGEKEVENDPPMPFVGAAGKELRRLFSDAGIDHSAVTLTNVVQYRPPSNDFTRLCVKKREATEALPGYSIPPLGSGKYLHPDHLSELHRLKQEIEEWKPNLVIALGATPLWALTGIPQISAARGSVMESTLVPGQKVIATYHPASLFREWSNRVIVVADLIKAKAEAKFPEIRRPKREVWLSPTIEDLWEWYKRYVKPGQLVSSDIETPSRRFIDCIGFAADPGHAIVVPFIDRTKEELRYWQSNEEEVEAWRFVKFICENHPILGQNFWSYDTIWLLSKVNIRPRHRHCTMLAHHAIQPEMPKKLGFLTSIYTNEMAHKLIRPRGYGKSVKRED